MIKKIYVSDIPQKSGLDVEQRIEKYILEQEKGTLVVQDDNEKMMFYPRESTVAEMVEVLDLLPPDFHISVMGNDELAIAVDVVEKAISIDRYNYILNKAALFLSDNFEAEEETFENLEELANEIRYSFSIKCCSNNNEIILLRSNTVAEIKSILKRYSKEYVFVCAGTLRHQILINTRNKIALMDEPCDLPSIFEDYYDYLDENYYDDQYICSTQESAIYNRLYTTINYDNPNTFFVFKSYLSALNYLQSVSDNAPIERLKKLIRLLEPTYSLYDWYSSTPTNAGILNANRIYYYVTENSRYPRIFADYNDCVENWENDHSPFYSRAEMEADIFTAEFKNGRFEVISRYLLGD